jgi:hypothetical protein
MEYFEAKSMIDAEPEKIWAALTDSSDLLSWPSGIVELKGRIAMAKNYRLFQKPHPAAHSSWK